MANPGGRLVAGREAGAEGATALTGNHIYGSNGMAAPYSIPNGTERTP